MNGAESVPEYPIASLKWHEQVQKMLDQHEAELKEIFRILTNLSED